MPESLLVIACGALAREINALRRRYGWRHVELVAIDARLHNRPEDIPGRLREAIHKHRDRCDRIYVAYADCGTAGGIDAVIDEEGVERLAGAHCYAAYAGAARFAGLAAEEPGTFYLTDFLARHFERLVIEPLGLDRRPELRDTYFGNYRRVVYLSQTHDDALSRMAAAAADRLGLRFEHVHTGYGALETGLVRALTEQVHGEENSRLLA
jgi:hypothetical protein